jgi:phage terminase large subunit-like protein
LAGRGFGKTRSAAEWIAWNALRNPNTRWAVVAPTFTDARDTCAEGVSGLVTILREYGVLKDYNRSMGEIVLLNKSRIKLFSGEEPDRLRGPQFHGGWFDELAAFKYPEAWDQYKFALRLGEHPQTIVTTTPRPTKQIKELVSREGTLVQRGSTFDNAANLSESALQDLKRKYEGTRLGRQELYGEIIDEIDGALWTRAMLDEAKVETHPPLARIVVGLDPAVTSNPDSDETGIIVAGVTGDGHYYVLEDCTIKASPDTWARVAVDAYHRHGADRVIGETNNGGDMIELLLRQVDPSVSFRKVTATRGKLVRAEPVAALSEQNRLHLVGNFPRLEDELTNYTPIAPGSPDRMDAMVWAITELMDSRGSIMGLAAISKFCPACRLPNIQTATNCQYCNEALGA